ncbi:MAG: hypothetical protein IJQ82_12285, partial [Selenomonadaceae bacterium]|nr:hypothetical protein [Selenomonadaceae bacterium]
MTEKSRKILLSELYKLSPLAQEAVNELLAGYEERRTILNAEKFLYELTNIPKNSQGVPKNLITRLNNTIDVLMNSLRWFSSDDLPHEIWRDVVDYEGLYQVSIFSRVKSFYGREPRI